MTIARRPIVEATEGGSIRGTVSIIIEDFLFYVGYVTYTWR